MSTVQIMSGDFEQGAVRIRYSAAGRAYMRVTSRDGFVEDLFLEKDLAACFDTSEGRVGDKLRRWAEENGIRETSAGARGERVFAVMLKDGRRMLGRTTLDVVAEMKTAARGEGLPPMPPQTASAVSALARPGIAGFVARLFPSRH